MRRQIKLKARKKTMPETKIEEIKAEICQLIIEHAARLQWEHRYLAEYLGVSVATVSRINLQRFKKISLEKLFTYLERVRPHYRFLIAP